MKKIENNFYFQRKYAPRIDPMRRFGNSSSNGRRDSRDVVDGAGDKRRRRHGQPRDLVQLVRRDVQLERRGRRQHGRIQSRNFIYINLLRFTYGKLPEVANYYGMR